MKRTQLAAAAVLAATPALAANSSLRRLSTHRLHQRQMEQAKIVTDSERVIRARIAQLNELLTELEKEDARIKLLMHDHYERLEHHLEQEQAT